jgi:RimJ/RimL family protein N-acetyltransferase
MRPMDRVRLVPLAEEHLGDVAGVVADPDVVRFTRFPDPLPADFLERFLARYEDGRRDGTRAGFVAVDPEDRLLGLALVPEIDREAREMELGYMVAPAVRGRGVATEMLRLLTRWAFDEARALRAYLIINVANAPSERVAERCGYVREGVMRSWHLKDAIRIDAALWSRLPSDPEP